LPLRIIDSETDFDPIEDIENTGELKFQRDTLKSKNDFWSYMNCTMDASTNFNFNPLIKSNLNHLIDFISSFQNLSHQTADFLQQAIIILMRKHFEQHGIILNYDKWDCMICNIISFLDNLFASFTKNEFDYIFRFNNIISSNNNIVLSFNDYIELGKNNIDPVFRNQFFSISDCKKNLLIFFNLPNLDSLVNDNELDP
jgi:hypothetical protein